MSLNDTITSVQGQVLEGLTSVQSQVLDTLASVQAPVVDVVTKAVEAVDGVLPADRPEVPFVGALPQPADLVDQGFGFAEKMLVNQNTFAKKVLSNQHDFAKAIVKAVSPLLPAAPKAAPKPKVAKAAPAA